MDCDACNEPIADGESFITVMIKQGKVKEGQPKTCLLCGCTLFKVPYHINCYRTGCNTNT